MDIEKDVDKITAKFPDESRRYKWRFDSLRKSYTEYIEKSKPLTYYIKKFNKQKGLRYLEVSTEDDLHRLLYNAIDKDLRKWVEKEGAYKFINQIKFETKTKQKETLIQKTLVSQFENILFKRDLRQFDVLREVEVLNGEKVDFLIKYGFIGPIMIEIKLSSNSGFVNNKKGIIEYKKKLEGYLAKTNSTKGLYVIFNDSFDRKFDEKIKKYKIEYDNSQIKVVGIDCMVEYVKK
jgi:hypothetical protein